MPQLSTSRRPDRSCPAALSHLIPLIATHKGQLCVVVVAQRPARPPEGLVPLRGASDKQRMKQTVPARRTTAATMYAQPWPIDAYGDYIEPAAVPALRHVIAVSPPPIGDTVRRHKVDREPGQVDRSPIWWPLTVVALLLAVVAIAVAPAGGMGLTL